MNLDGLVPQRTLDFVAEAQEFILEMGDNPHKMDRAYLHFSQMVDNVTRLRGAVARSIQLFTPLGADYLLDIADRHHNLFEENGEEGAAYRIPEIILKNYPATMDGHLLAVHVGEQILWPIFHLMYGHAPNYFSAVQLARYRAPSNRGTGWHSDTESEATCTVSLAPERHTGGGTLLMERGALDYTTYVPPLRKGEALLFNGRTTLHRGLELEDGERNLLVYWMRNKT